MQLQIGNIIARARRARELTQENLADMLGVSAAAVSKWETGASCPDITLLSPLARALGMTVDTLLGFHAAPADEEIHAITKRLHEIFDKEGFDAGRQAAEAVLREYPTSGSLKLAAGSLYYHYLASALNRAEDAGQAAEEISRRCLALFEQGEAQSTDAKEQTVAKMLRINTLTMLGRYEEAEHLIDELPAKQAVDPDVLRLNLYIAQDKLADAELLSRRALLTHVGEVSTALMNLATVARRQKDFAAAHRFVNAFCAVDGLFGLDRSTGLLLGIMLAQDEGDNEKALDLFERYIDAQLACTLDYRDNPFFAAVQTHAPTHNEIAETRRLTLRAIEEDERYAPIRDEPRFRAALGRLRAAILPEA